MKVRLATYVEVGLGGTMFGAASRLRDHLLRSELHGVKLGHWGVAVTNHCPVYGL